MNKTRGGMSFCQPFPRCKKDHFWSIVMDIIFIYRYERLFLFYWCLMLSKLPIRLLKKNGDSEQNGRRAQSSVKKGVSTYSRSLAFEVRSLSIVDRRDDDRSRAVSRNFNFPQSYSSMNVINSIDEVEAKYVFILGWKTTPHNLVGYGVGNVFLLYVKKKGTTCAAIMNS